MSTFDEDETLDLHDEPRAQDEEVTILKKVYEQLKEDSDLLEALRQSGVDNWDGWSDALSLVEEWKKS